MAAKLKKRAMAEYQSQTIVQEARRSTSSSDAASESHHHQPRKRLKLILSGRSGVSVNSRTAEQNIFPLENSSQMPNREISSMISVFVSRIKYMESEDLLEATKKLCEFLKKSTGDPIIRMQAILALTAVLEQGKKATECRSVVKEYLPNWVETLKTETSHKIVCGMLGFLAKLYENNVFLSKPLYEVVFEVANAKLKERDHQIKIQALKAISKCAVNEDNLVAKCLSLVGKFTHSTDPRVRQAAYESLLNIHQSGHKMEANMYTLFCRALTDDFDNVRLAGLKLVSILAHDFPDEQIKLATKGGNKTGNDSIRLVDDAFGKICNAINDLSVQVRETAAQLIGGMVKVSQDFLEQTLDKKLMSNMRLKRSAHEREAKMISSGEWSSGILNCFYIDSRGRSTLTAGSDHYFHTKCLYVLLRISKTKQTFK